MYSIVGYLFYKDGSHERISTPCVFEGWDQATAFVKNLIAKAPEIFEDHYLITLDPEPKEE